MHDEKNRAHIRGKRNNKYNIMMLINKKHPNNMVCGKLIRGGFVWQA
jgi:hypothetical protein